MSKLPGSSGHHNQDRQQGEEDEGVPPLQGEAKPSAPKAPRGVPGKKGPIEVRISPVVGMTSSTWGLRAYIWGRLVREGIPLRATADLYSDPVATSGTLTWWEDSKTQERVFRWTP